MGRFEDSRLNGGLDPSAGVSLVRVIVCPRCGVSKGLVNRARRGLCRDCADVVGVVDRQRWVA